MKAPWIVLITLRALVFQFNLLWCNHPLVNEYILEINLTKCESTMDSFNYFKSHCLMKSNVVKNETEIAERKKKLLVFSNNVQALLENPWKQYL